MEIFWNIFETVVTIFEAFVVTHFVLSFQRFNYRQAQGRVKYICASMINALLVMIMNFLVPFEGALGVIYIVYFVLISFILTDSKVYVKFFASIVGVLGLLLVSVGFSSFLSAFFKEPIGDLLTKHSILRLFCVLSVQIVRTFLYDIILRVTKKNEFILDGRAWLLILVVFCISFASVALIQSVAVSGEYNDYTPMLLGAMGFIILTAIACFYMTVMLNRTQQESEKFKLLSQQDDFRKQYAENVKKQYDDVRRIRHDMKQSCAVILMLLNDGKTDEATEYLKKFTSSVTTNEVIIDVGNDFVNAILNTKLSAAKQQGIKILCAADKSVADFDDIDMCNLLGNMLDNAIEACLKCGEGQRMLEVNIRTINSQYLIEVINSTAENVAETNSALETTKSDKELHGYGIKSIREIAEKYNGNVTFVEQGNLFRCDVVLSK